MKIIYLWLFTLLLCACDSNLSDINNNPNKPTSMNAEALLNKSIKSTLDLFGGRMNREVFLNYVNYIHPGGGEFQRYGYAQTMNNNYFNTMYVFCIKPLQDIIDLYGNNPSYKNRVAIARIFQSYIYSQGVAIWGPIPRSKALTGASHTPYDNEEKIYTDLLDDLKYAVESLDDKGDTFDGKGDALYSGDVKKWRKLGNSLRLRLILRISECAQGELLTSIQMQAEEIMQSENSLIASNEEEATLRWGMTSSTWSHLYEYIIFYGSTLTSENFPVMGETFMQYLNYYTDGRIAHYAEQSKIGSLYWGRPKSGATFPWFIDSGGVGSPHANKTQNHYSTIGNEYLRPDADWSFMTYSEVCFTQSELILREFSKKSDNEARIAYENGIRASMEKAKISASEVEKYLSQNGVKWGIKSIVTPLDTLGRENEYLDWLKISSCFIEGDDEKQVKKHQIMTQAWIALYPHALDAWTWQRRTQLMEFTPHYVPGNTAITMGMGYALIPQRILYPQIEHQTNAEALQQAIGWLQGTDDMNTSLWFTKPVKRDFFGYPNGLPMLP